MRAVRAVLRRAQRGLAAAPSWFRILLAVVITVLGAVILLRPVTSLGMLALLIGVGLVLQGVLDLIGSGSPRRPDLIGSGSPRRPDLLGSGSPHRPDRWRRLAPAALWIAAGVVVLVLTGLTLRLLAVVVAVALVVNGAASVVAAIRRRTTAGGRIADAAFGVAGVVFGILALGWRDVASLVVAVAFGVGLMLSGLVLGWTTLRRTTTAPTGGRRRLASGWPRVVASVVAIVLAAGAATLSVDIRADVPVAGDFYTAPPQVPDEPGRLLRAEPFTGGVPDGARAWRILYTTTHGDGGRAVASGLVVVPADGAGPWPVIDWNHGTTGVAQHCAPSLADEPFESGALLVLPEIIARGWALVATDYIGLGTQGPHPYLIDPDNGHASLDAVRAAHELEEADLGEQSVVWGHSQGGGAALWTGAVLDGYAPELEIAGVAALAPASDLRGLVETLPDAFGGTVIASFVAAAYTAEYDDVTYREYFRPGAEAIVPPMAERCLTTPGVLVSGAVALALSLSQDSTILAADPAAGAFGRRLAQNEPPATISVPLLVGQGVEDGIVTPQVQDGYVERLCDAGVAVDYRRYPDLDHLSLVQPDSPLIPELIEWTQDRFDGVPVAAECVWR